MSKKFKYDVFLSHSSKDKIRVVSLAERLRAAGMRVWLDEWIIKPGENIYLAVERGLEMSRVMVLCLSQSALDSGWVGMERSAAIFGDPLNSGRNLIPVLLTKCKLPKTLGCLKYIDFCADSDAAFQNLLHACTPGTTAFAQSTPRPADDESVFLAPRDIPHFTGRSAEMRRLKFLLQPRKKCRASICCIAGIAGVGKSSLAAHFANLHRDLYTGGVFWVSLDEQTPIEVARNIGTALNEPMVFLHDDNQAHARIQFLMRKRRALLVLDNADHHSAAGRIAKILPGAIDVSVIITTRNKALSETVAAELLELKGFTVAEGRSLFAKVLGSDPRLVQELNEIGSLVALADGLPLLISPAGLRLARRRQMSISEYKKGIESSRNSASLAAVILDKSLALLNRRAKDTFFALASCAGSGFSVQTAMYVSQISRLAEMRAQLYELVDLSLIHELADDRFALHPVIKTCARTMSNVDRVDLRHAMRWARYVNRYCSDSPEDWNLLAAEWDGIRLAWDWCLSHYYQVNYPRTQQRNVDRQALALGVQLAYGLRYFLDACGQWNESLERMQKCVEAARTIGNAEHEFRLRRHFGLLLRKLGQLKKSERQNRLNMKFAALNKRRDWKGLELEQLGRIRLRQGFYDEASRFFRRSLIIAQSVKGANKKYVLQSLNCLGVVALRQERPEKALVFFSKALEKYKKIGQADGVASCYAHLGDAYVGCGETTKALTNYVLAISGLKASGRLELEGSVFLRLGLLFEKLMRPLDALACYILSAAIYEKIGIPGWNEHVPAQKKECLSRFLGKIATPLGHAGDHPDLAFERATRRILKIVKAVSKLTPNANTGDGSLPC